jgi:hypothetical protein
LITAFVGVAAFVLQATQSSADGRADPVVTARAQPAAGVASGPQSSGAAEPAGSTTPTPSPDEMKGSGPYEVLFNNNGVDLDADPPRVATGPDSQIDIYDASSSRVSSFPIWSGLATWTEAGAPTRSGCIALLNGFATHQSAFTKGTRVCVHTRGEQHVALIEFVEPMSQGWRLRVTVWPGTAA